MKIEKINDNQIKCTLTRSDLASHQLRLSEIAYGTEKANGLFRDMMDQANLEFGFDTADLPIMIEAIPVSMDCIILMITKVEDPEEVNPRYPGLSVLDDLWGGNGSDSMSGPDSDIDSGEYPDNMFLNLESMFKDPHPVRPVHTPRQRPGSVCLLSFDSLEHVMMYARQIKDCTLTDSSLYKSSTSYYLILRFSLENSSDYAYASTAALEFGFTETATAGRLAYIQEHEEPILTGDAVALLASV